MVLSSLVALEARVDGIIKHCFLGTLVEDFSACQRDLAGVPNLLVVAKEEGVFEVSYPETQRVVRVKLDGTTRVGLQIRGYYYYYSNMRDARKEIMNFLLPEP